MADDRPEFDLYAQDFYAWTQAQAEALRLRGAGGSALDYDRLAEEVGDLGAAEWNACWTLLARIVQHLHKLELSPATLPRNKWRSEIRVFRTEVERRLTRSIRGGMQADLESIHRKGARNAQGDMEDHGDGVSVDPERRWLLEQLLGEADDPLETDAFR
jgi:hypothetical protein